MKTLCVAVVLLSLTSVCQPAPLVCEKLLKPEDRSPDIAGRWYFIAVAADSCMVTSLLNAVFWPSLGVDIASTGIGNIYEAKFMVKMYGYCESESEKLWYGNNTILDVDSNNAPTGKPDGLLQSSCSDCLVIKTEGDGLLSTLMFISRRKTVTADELKEFETQVNCIGWSKPQVLNTDHEYANCPSIDSANDGAAHLIFERLKITYKEPLQCLADTLLSYPKAAYDWVQQSWDSLW